ncbi:enoyl-CoA hydratase/isomerase family protein [Geomicrobium sp. JCM 19038]|uniref:enoyl-CoA hydratase/isomerase family protein n=1 Tax=Geomicrobium sp. JCM 19038 TaxID=1460635 RepID=UPI000693A8FF|nr:enoyl-CoA hydratase/isomerase family protein [Geomicrobium sp. JCM 19038]
MNNETKTTDELLVQLRENVCYVTFQRPTYYNAFTPSLLQSLTSIIEDSDRNDQVRAIVITGAGKAFCSGQDLKAMKSAETYDQLLENNYHPLLRVMRAAKTPLIAAVNGTAAGAGMSLSLACDYRLVHANTTFISAFTNIGLVPDAGMMYDLPRLVGSAKAFEIATLNEKNLR